MSKSILICISGTGQETADSKDNAIDNPLKIAVRGGWKGYAKPSDVEGQHVIYVPGIGTRESQKHIEGDRGAPAKIDAAGNAILAPQEAVDARRAYILEQLEIAGYARGDTICITGFSRGAAEARQLAASFTKDSIPVRLLCCFDTVAQIGGPDKSEWPDDGLLFEDDAVAESVEQAIHLVSIDEDRLTFPPTLMDHDDRVREVWFAGVHSDVGVATPSINSRTLRLPIWSNKCVLQGLLSGSLGRSMRAVYRGASGRKTSPTPQTRWRKCINTKSLERAFESSA